MNLPSESVEATYWPKQAWLAGALLAGHLLFPGPVWVICLLTETPTGDAIDWGAKSPALPVFDALFFAHFFYALVLIAVMQGWRVQAIAAGIAGLLVSAASNFLAYFAVTGIYW
jgi:hypothetical protein